MKICSINVNGIRASFKKGLFDWLSDRQFDVVCLQETRAKSEILVADQFQLNGYSQLINTAEKAGYSGVALYAKGQIEETTKPLGLPWFDTEGRYVEARVGSFVVGSLYLPSGSAKDDRQILKYEAMDAWRSRFEEMVASGEKYVVVGDINIAHKKIDIKNWRGNQKNSGFLPAEREWMTALIDEVGMVDAFREINQDEGQYTWWSNRGQARANNVGWRIDYQLATPNLRSKIKSAEIYTGQNLSDHAPLIIDYQD